MTATMHQMDMKEVPFELRLKAWYMAIKGMLSGVPKDMTCLCPGCLRDMLSQKYDFATHMLNDFIKACSEAEWSEEPVVRNLEGLISIHGEYVNQISKLDQSTVLGATKALGIMAGHHGVFTTMLNELGDQYGLGDLDHADVEAMLQAAGTVLQEVVAQDLLGTEEVRMKEIPIQPVMYPFANDSQKVDDVATLTLQDAFRTGHFIPC